MSYQTPTGSDRSDLDQEAATRIKTALNPKSEKEAINPD
jgi:hypothetical protein